MRTAFYKLNILLTICLFLNSCTKEDVAPDLLVGWKEETEGRVQFTNLTENADSFLWEFDDKTTSTEKTPVKIYTKNGDYQVKVTATKGSKTTSKTLAVKVTNVILPVLEFRNDLHNFNIEVGTYKNPDPLKPPFEFIGSTGLVYSVSKISFPDRSQWSILLGTLYDGPDPIINYTGFTQENIKEITKVLVATQFGEEQVFEYRLTFDKPYEISISRVDKGNYAIRYNFGADKQICKSISFKGCISNLRGLAQDYVFEELSFIAHQSNS
ncbi:PKD domain containing protein [Runella slithyformis DSM 19594]|uniref:PKD domain containing protein n=2 Tax=Runella TaxID=105 RepID=A0A7U3ZQ91_RUNSL|nr:PKD domain containing protein [Runella slithyformis DSM 19594]